MIRKKEIETLPVLHAKATGAEEWIGRVRMVGDAIVMDVYDARRIMCPEGVEKSVEISFRWACDGKNFYTYRFDQKTWGKKGLYYSMHGYAGYYSYDIGIKVDQTSQKIAEAFFERHKLKTYTYRKDAANLFQVLEEELRRDKRDREEKRRQERIRKRQMARKALPKDWDRWLDHHVFKEKRYLFYDAKKRKEGTCAHCCKSVKLSGTQKNSQYGICPSCGSRIQYKSVGKEGSRLDKEQVIYLQKTENGFLTRYLIAEKYSTPEGEKYRSHDAVLGTWDGEEMRYDFCMISAVDGKEYWRDSKPLDMSGWKGTGQLYTRNIKQVLKGTVFQYAPLKEWARHEGEEILLDRFLGKYQSSPFMEFFIKEGLWRLTRDYVAMDKIWTGRSPEEILGIDKHQLKRLIKMNGGRIALGWLKYEKKHMITIKDDLIQRLENEYVYAGTCENILDICRSVTKMINYMDKQEMDLSEVITIWEDYLRMAKTNGMDMEDDIVRFPKKLRQRHDQLVNMKNAEQDRERLKRYAPLDEKIRQRLPGASRYYWENKKYMIVPAGACEELIKEGRSLHHCVGKDDHYMKKMAEGRSWICFLRKKEDLETPWYTIEINMEDDRILQYYSMFNRKPEKKTVMKILDAFMNSVKRKKSQVRVQVENIA